MSAEFRQIANRNGSGKSERLVRAAVSAFCSLPRPTKRETQQLGQLVLPLFDRIQVETKRFVAASLSDSRYAPHDLVARVCEEPVDVCAPLLIRSSALTDADLVRIIGNKGAAHARVIMRRPNLHPALAALSERLGRSTPDRSAAEGRVAPKPADARTSDPLETRAAASPALEDMRGRLRHIMAGSSSADRLGVRPSSRLSRNAGDRVYLRLKANALSGNAAFFRSALADALGIDYSTAQAITGSRSYDDLVAALRHVGLSEEEAFLLVCAACPERFRSTADIREFTERYRTLGSKDAAAAQAHAPSDGQSVSVLQAVAAHSATR